MASDILKFTLTFVRTMRITDVIDILIVAIIVYYAMMALRGTRAVQVVRGIFIAVVIYFLSGALRLNALNYILSTIMQIAALALIVIFQPELRKLLEQIGQLKLVHVMGFALDSDDDSPSSAIENIAQAAENMANSRTGALIVLERKTRLGEYMHSGTMLDANVTSELLENIFVPNTPLHDGAVIIRNNKIITAGCVLPLTANTNLASELGTRHRAALGLSETSDAVVIVVSEETGKISIAMNGSLTRNLSRSALEKALTKLMADNTYENMEFVKKIKFRNKSK